MGYLRSTQRSKLYNEFTEDYQEKYFSLSDKKFIPHVDTLYYSIFIKGDMANSKNEEESVPGGVLELIDFLQYSKTKFEEEDLKFQKEFWYDYDKSILFTSNRFSLYEYCISKKGYYDIFISSYLPNDLTPRIVIQLRSIGLWGIGEYELVSESFEVVKNLLSDYGLEIEKTQENRIDFCYHTNILQSPENVYSDNSLSNNLHTTFSIYNKVGRKHGRNLTVEYLSLGQRSSNNIFFRSYNKVREVIEENYKEFFLELWFNSKVINYYDFYVYSYAFKKKNYGQIYWGMLEFYLEFGLDPKVREDFLYIKEHPKDYPVEELKKILLEICPKPTLVINIEFQCMRKFFYSFNKALELSKPAIENECKYIELLRVFQILDNRKLFLEYLTENTVSFKKDLSEKHLIAIGKINKENVYQDFWKRLRATKLQLSFNGTIRRDYTSNINKELIMSRIKSSIATLSLYNDDWDTDLNNDLANFICILNDNDMALGRDGIIDIEYEKLKDKKKKALKSILECKSRPSNNK